MILLISDCCDDPRDIEDKEKEKLMLLIQLHRLNTEKIKFRTKYR